MKAGSDVSLVGEASLLYIRSRQMYTWKSEGDEWKVYGKRGEYVCSFPTMKEAIDFCDYANQGEV
jgi:hypothetical protein